MLVSRCPRLSRYVEAQHDEIFFLEFFIFNLVIYILTCSIKDYYGYMSLSILGVNQAS